MAKELAYEVWIDDGKKQILWTAQDNYGNKTSYITDEQIQIYRDKICEKVSKGMTKYVNNHPKSTLLN